MHEAPPRALVAARRRPPIGPLLRGTGATPDRAASAGDEADAPAGAPPVDRPSFETFYRDSHADVARALAYTLGDTDLGTEATDEAMARACARWADVAGYDNPAGWVYRVGLNWARSVHRRLARRLPGGRGEVNQPPVADPAVARALAALDPAHRAVVVCRLLLDWSTADTADALGVRPGTVKSRLHRALRTLEGRLHHMRGDA